MGANSVNTMAETVAPRLAELSGGRVGLRILSNLADRRVVRVSARVPFAALTAHGTGPTGSQVAEGIAAASRFAEDDPYRAATHNKGIMNGVDAVVMATGNDWRGVEAGAHVYAARDGRYRPLSTWKVEGESLLGRLEMPMAVGTVGGTLQVHPGARLALRILRVSSSEELGMVIGAAGLGQNLAALRALATEGIQPRSHDPAQTSGGRCHACPERTAVVIPCNSAQRTFASRRQGPWPCGRAQPGGLLPALVDPATRSLDRGARLPLLRGVRPRPPREFPGGFAFRAVGATAPCGRALRLFSVPPTILRRAAV